jgi:hypothetical protein
MPNPLSMYAVDAVAAIAEERAERLPRRHAPGWQLSGNSGWLHDGADEANR